MYNSIFIIIYSLKFPICLKLKFVESTIPSNLFITGYSNAATIFIKKWI